MRICRLALPRNRRHTGLVLCRPVLVGHEERRIAEVSDCQTRRVQPIVLAAGRDAHDSIERGDGGAGDIPGVDEVLKRLCRRSQGEITRKSRSSSTTAAPSPLPARLAKRTSEIDTR